LRDQRAGLRDPDHAPVHRRRQLPRVRRGVRRQAVADRPPRAPQRADLPRRLTGARPLVPDVVSLRAEKGVPEMTFQTRFGSLADFHKGGVEAIDDDPRHYVFSNVFDVASRSKPWERVCVAKNFEYVIEAASARGDSPYWTARHDEFVLCMDGEVEVELH